MLYRMYSKWADSHGFKTEVLDYLDGDEAGIKSITFEVNGEKLFELTDKELYSDGYFGIRLLSNRAAITGFTIHYL